MSDKTPGQLRDEVWTSLMRAKVAAYPLPAFGHHPNFQGAGEAASRLLAFLLARGWLHPGDTVFSYPDYVLKPLRKGALEAGVDLVVPAKHPDGWRLLAAGRVNPAKAASIAGAERWGEAIAEPPPCRLAFIACVAVDGRGFVLGKGYGFSLGLNLPAVSIVHPLQVLALQVLAELPEGKLRLEAYATPAEVCEVR
jgi:5-formyltetrahydrofolate cyclo-ligase